MQKLILGLILILAVLCTGCHRDASKAKVHDRAETKQIGRDDLDEVRHLISNRNFDAARDALDRYLQEHPDDPAALEMAGDGAIQANDSQSALEYFAAAVDACDAPTKELWFKWAGVAVSAERPFEAIDILRDAATDYPDLFEIRQNLATLLSRMGLQNEAAEHLRWLVQHKRGSQSILLQLADLTFPQTHDPTCRSALQRNPRDLRPLFSLAQKDVAQSNWKNVKEALEPVVKDHPDFLQAVALYGHALVELDDVEEIKKWSESLPAGIESYSDYWMAAGRWASRHGRSEQAARAFANSVRLNEDDAAALIGLSTSLIQLDRNELADIAAHRAERIGVLKSQLATLANSNFDSQKAVVDLALTLQELGRVWEATNWLMIGYSMEGNPDPRLETTFRTIRGDLTGSTPWQIPEKIVSTKIDLDSLPTVSWTQSDKNVSLPVRTIPDVKIHFRDEATLRSLNHVCAIGKTAGTDAGLMIYQSGAGGAGVIDFDQDGWPDLYLTVMDGKPNGDDSQPNRLHRNMNGKFSDITDSASLVDPGYSQGISIGDYNSDGWPDVLVANIGANHLFRNNGDGTFRDVTAECHLDGSGWTTSVAVADLNGDGHADLYEVGYCRGEEPLQKPCIIETARSCNPMGFDAEPDRIWAGNGDGTFSEATRWLRPHQTGRGLGLVVGDLDQRPGLEIYVANDMTANHFWSIQKDANQFALSEQATVRGLAFDRQSNAQASMGIAAADADHDGDIDFLLTHFVDEYNTYYEQQAAGFWSDESQVAGFAEPSRTMLGYGTQWIDVNNDGALEAFIANGDIDDFEFEGRDYRQPPQLMFQSSKARWQLMKSAQAGDYFTKKRLARAVAKLDANRDGFSDLVVTHLFDPVALLINRTATNAQQTRFFLRSKSTHRDAIGASIRFNVGDQISTQQLLAGNGFQCTNEACLVFGTSDAEFLQDVQILWPQGTRESLGRLAPGRDYLIVEGLGASLLPFQSIKP